MSRSTFSVLFYVNRGKEKGGTTRLSISGRAPRRSASDGQGDNQWNPELERNVWAGNKYGIRQYQQFVINYEDSIRRRHQMEIAAQQREQESQRLMRESDGIRKKLK